ncbi:hypothetical protein K7432_017081 [Basidiobolus ranarum]|uniref:Uncharacterized protein n=1 Tax=Basidiobolus ranarum TaxID=34480 RepID=A0ABR2WDU5_9FUNG
MDEPVAYTGYASTILSPNVESAKPSPRSKTKTHRKATEDPFSMDEPMLYSGYAEVITSEQHQPVRNDKSKPVVNNNLMKPQKHRSIESTKSSLRKNATTRQMAVEDLFDMDEPMIYSGYAEVITSEQHLPARKDKSKPIANNNLVKPQKNRNVVSAKASTRKNAKTRQMVVENPFSVSEPILHSGYAEVIPSEQLQPGLSTRKDVKPVAVINSVKPQKSNGVEASKPPRKVKNPASNNIDDLIDKLKTLGVGQKDSTSRNPNGNNTKAKNPADLNRSHETRLHVSDQAPSNVVKKSFKSNKRSRGKISTKAEPITPPTSDENRTSRIQPNISTDSKSSSQSSKPRRRKKSNRNKGPRSENDSNTILLE